MANPFDMYATKKKRAVDPNAPPRPNLLSHEKTLKDTRGVIERQERQIQMLISRVGELENKLQNQTIYLSALHQSLNRKIEKR
jgi:hypothetical protein